MRWVELVFEVWFFGAGEKRRRENLLEEEEGGGEREREKVFGESFSDGVYRRFGLWVCDGWFDKADGFRFGS